MSTWMMWKSTHSSRHSDNNIRHTPPLSITHTRNHHCPIFSSSSLPHHTRNAVSSKRTSTSAMATSQSQMQLALWSTFFSKTLIQFNLYSHADSPPSTRCEHLACITQDFVFICILCHDTCVRFRRLRFHATQLDSILPVECRRVMTVRPAYVSVT